MAITLPLMITAIHVDGTGWNGAGAVIGYFVRHHTEANFFSKDFKTEIHSITHSIKWHYLKCYKCTEQCQNRLHVSQSVSAARNWLSVVAPSMLTDRRRQPMRQQQ